jgi:hypothetical protein
LLPGCVEQLRGQTIVGISAAKFHSAAVSASGQLFTWVRMLNHLAGFKPLTILLNGSPSPNSDNLIPTIQTKR